ncbi:MAG: DUF4038 domain-containing protein [Bacteroidales bacterium]|nr:DUF4038 domain-containing protein [Bacteroidales bacterium]
MKRFKIHTGLLCLLLFTGCNFKSGKMYDDVTPGTADTVTTVWQCTELPFFSSKKYTNPLTGDEQCDMNVIFTHKDGTTIERPAFWDGENIFKVRFAPTKTGLWKYETICKEDKSLNGIKGTVGANGYKGDLAIYRHGFLDISGNKRYLVYNDGTPFFYLGDTHWSLPYEAFDTSGVPGITSQFRHIVNTRIDQGFTVFQSEPIQWENHTGKDLCYTLEEFGADDLGGFANLDRKFKYLADKGMVHANAQLFFTNELGNKREQYPDEYIDKLTRYWVARYGAYPVMWTCAQEADNDFYFDRENDQRNFDSQTNPWKIVAAALNKYDSYHHPLSAHMEYASGSAPKDGHGTIASNSSFKNIEGHNWYACQWSPDKTKQFDFRVPKDFWNSENIKPTVNYEGQYDHFWTNTFGARMQGWTAYLNGMYGYGYGAAGIWLIINKYPDDMAGGYDLDRDTDKEITKEVKRMEWNKALYLPAAEQVGKHMRNFLENLEWSDLKESYYALASIENNLYVCYFYNNDLKTGTLKNMKPGITYTAKWYDPRTGEYHNIGKIRPEDDGTWNIPEKPDSEDWVLFVG